MTKTIFEEMGGTYRQVGDYLLPNITVPAEEEIEPIGLWGKRHASGANVLILDEPTRNFSPLSGPVIRKMLREFPGAVISISHDRKYIEEVCDKIYQLNPNGLQLIGD